MPEFRLYSGGEGEQHQHSLGGASAVLLVLSGGVLPIFVRCKFGTLHGLAWLDDVEEEDTHQIRASRRACSDKANRNRPALKMSYT